jgi:hypothetical protein
VAKFKIAKPLEVLIVNLLFTHINTFIHELELLAKMLCNIG